jgi:Ni/Fe-hydrogenase subunit HybB-like protein
MVMLATKTIRSSFRSLLFCHGLVLLGIVFNRFNVVFIAQQEMGGSYFPSWIELAVTVGLVSGGVFLYRLAVTYLPIFSPASGSAE